MKVPEKQEKKEEKEQSRADLPDLMCDQKSSRPPTVDYDIRFEKFIESCKRFKDNPNMNVILLPNPESLGENYQDVMKSLNWLRWTGKYIKLDLDEKEEKNG